MESFKYGNGVWATKTGSSLAYNDENDNYKPLPFSVTRNSIATRVNKEGLIEVVGKDKLRIDYTDSTKGVALLEPARTNYLKNNETLQGTGWSNVGGLTLNFDQNDPFGGNNAVKITDFNDTGDRYDANTIKSGVDGETVTYSGYYKGSGSINIAINTGTGLGGALEKTIYLTDEWVRHEVTYTFTSAVTGNYRAHTAITRTANNDAVVYLSYPQIEVGSYPTSIIITGDTAVPRAADVANGAGNSEVFNDSEGVLFADIAALADDSTYRNIGLTDNTINNRILFQYSNTPNTISVLIIDGGITQSSLNFTSSNIKNYSKVALKYKVNDVALWVNGFEIGTDTSATMPSGLNTLSFDNSVNSDDFYGKTKRIGYFDAVLTDAELEALTSYTSFTNMANELNLTIK